MTLPGTAGLPAPDSRPLGASHASGRLIVEMAAQDRRPSQVLTSGSFHNAIVALAAIGESTNAVVHLLAIAGRLGVPSALDDFDRIGAGVPLPALLQPAGRHLMEDFQTHPEPGDGRRVRQPPAGLGAAVRGPCAAGRHRRGPRLPRRIQWRGRPA